MDIKDQVFYDIENAIGAYKTSYFVKQEAYLAYHQISMDSFINGIKSHDVIEKNEDGRTVTTKEFETQVRTGVFSTAVDAVANQIAIDSVETRILTTVEANELFNKGSELFLDHLYRESKTDLEVNYAKMNAILFGEFVFRIGFDKEKNLPTTRAINYFDFIPSTNWRTNIQECDYIATRMNFTVQQAKDYAKRLDISFSDDDFERVKTSQRNFFNPSLSIYKVYGKKIDPNLLMSPICADDVNKIGQGYGIIDTTTIEVFEYFNKSLGKHVITFGGEVVKEEDFIDKDYPFVAHRTSIDPLIGRGIGMAEKALAMNKTHEKFANFAVINKVQQLSQVFLYDSSSIPLMPQPGENVMIGIKPGLNTKLDQMVYRVPAFGNNLEIKQEQQDYEARVFSALGVNPFSVGAPISSGDVTSREVALRNNAMSASMLSITEGFNKYVLSEIMRWFLKIAMEKIDAEEVFSVVNGEDVYWIQYLPDVKFKEHKYYFEYKYKGLKFYEPKVGALALAETVKQFKNEDILDLEDPLSLDQGLETDVSDYIDPTKFNGAWSDFVLSIVEKTNGKIQYVLCKEELENFISSVEVVTGQYVRLDKAAQREELKTLLPFIQALGPNAIATVFKQIMDVYDIDVEDLLPQQPASQEQAGMSDDPTVNATINTDRSTQDPETIIAPNQDLNNNPQGLN